VKKIATIKQIVECGINTIDQNETLEIKLKDLVYIHRVLEEFMRFFHNNEHYLKLEDVKSFMGNSKSGGAYEVLGKAISEKTNKMIPKEIEDSMSDGIFGGSLIPSYYCKNDGK
jgi:hypothetical protein